jgi:outer membrane receptor protein involved in Fe transport
MAAMPGFAQEAAPATAQADVAEQDTGTITVTGSRIARDGFTAPTPVNVLSSVDIQVQSPPNIADFVNQLPSIQGSSTPSTGTGSVSGGQAGISAINLRGIGIGRTLVLLDGQRSVASSTTGVVDINTFPQALVERVEVVTGGASAAYGSDAIGGVVNFILKKDFTGLQLNADYGETFQGDGQNYNITGTAGAYLLDKRLHVMANFQYFLQEHIPRNDRDWNKLGYNIITNPAYVVGNGQPEFFIGRNTGPQLITPGGLIVSGPLRGTTFGTIDPATGTATVGRIAYGAAPNASAISMLGGDWEETSRWVNGSASFEPGQERIGAFGRATFEVTPSIELSFTASYNKQTVISNFLASVNNGNLTIRRDNAYLPASVAQAMDANGLSTITIGTSNLGLPPGGADFSREVYRYVLGAKGDFEVMGRGWNWDAYYQRGFSRSNERTNDVWNNARIAAATNAVRAVAGNPLGVPAGTIVCLVNVDSNPNNNMPGCVPMNRIGENGQSPESINYIFNDGNQPLRFQRLQQDVAALTFSGEIFDLPGGPAAFALGGEWRKEQVDSEVDPQFNSGWQYGNYRENRGEYTVKEAFLELALPVFTGAELNGAVRVTDYSTSGTVATWKVGATWQPIDDIRFRGTVSRDIRAPNLDELFSAGTGRSNSVQLREPGQPTRTIPYTQLATGNPDLSPEVARSWTIGAVATPTFLPGFAFSVDYYEVKIEDAIGSLQPQEIVDLCFVENDPFQCGQIDIRRDANGRIVEFPQIRLFPINYAFQTNKGIDFEASYRTPMDWMSSSFDGDLTLRASVTHYISNLIDDTLNPTRETVGQTSASQITTSGPPAWNYRLSAIYNSDRVTMALIGRGFSSGVIDNRATVCTSGCPLSTAESRTFNFNRVDGAFFMDASLAYRIPVRDTETQLQLTITNLFDKDPPLSPPGPTGDSQFGNPPTNRGLAGSDRLGRSFRLSLRFKY